MLIRQGDVLIGDVEAWPELAKAKCGKVRTDRVLAEGEATGHAHRARSGKLYETDMPGVCVLDVPEGTAVEHEEHKRVDVPPGRWFVRQKREYDHLAEEARRVQD